MREFLLSAADQTTAQVVARFDAAERLQFCSRHGSEGSPTVVKETNVMGVTAVSVDVGGVSDVLARLTSPAVVASLQPWGTAAARAGRAATLADQAVNLVSVYQDVVGR